LSDGVYVLMQDWHEFVGAAEEIIESLGKAQCTALARDPSSPLPLFLAGVSMGGGVCATLALRRPQMYSGMILEAPSKPSATLSTAAALRTQPLSSLYCCSHGPGAVGSVVCVRRSQATLDHSADL
jgi:pimeloyl-ACP methyl ester carboxylesterase